jgi:hypothetical protein
MQIAKMMLLIAALVLAYDVGTQTKGATVRAEYSKEYAAWKTRSENYRQAYAAWAARQPKENK